MGARTLRRAGDARDAAPGRLGTVLSALLALIAPPRCLACDAAVRAASRLCAACRADTPWLPGPAETPQRWAPVAFDGPGRALVHALKFGGRVAAADVMAAQI